MIRIIDDAIELNQLIAARDQFPNKAWPGWHRYDDENSKKLGSKPAADYPYECKLALTAMLSACSEIISPPHFADSEFFGSGLHMMLPGGYLRRHLDSSCHRVKGWERTYSCVLFLDECAGGNLNLETKTGVIQVKPRQNRLAIFRTTEDSWHWVDQVTGDFPRRSLSIFFWRHSSPADSTRISARFQNE